MADDIRFKDFSMAPDPVKFQVNADIFEAPPVLPIAVMQDIVSAIKDIRNVDQNDSDRLGNVVDGIGKVFAAILLETSIVRFNERLHSRGADALGVNQLLDILYWLLEVYGLRPTTPSSPSSTGQADDVTGTASTVGAESTTLTQQLST